eukprot:2537400-Rhodomonas_salina.1
MCPLLETYGQISTGVGQVTYVRACCVPLQQQASTAARRREAQLTLVHALVGHKTGIKYKKPDRWYQRNRECELRFGSGIGYAGGGTGTSYAACGTGIGNALYGEAAGTGIGYGGCGTERASVPSTHA